MNKELERLENAFVEKQMSLILIHTFSSKEITKNLMV